MNLMINYPTLLAVSALIFSTSLHAQTTRVFTNAGTGDNWSESTNWTGGTIADTNAEAAQLNASPTLDSSQTVARVQNFFASNSDLTISGPGVLTVDPNAINAQGIRNTAGGGNNGGLVFNSDVIINDSAATGTSYTSVFFASTGGSSRHVTFQGNLTLQSRLRTEDGTGGTVNFNGILASSAADLQINSSSTTFGLGHDSSSFGRDVVMFANSMLSVDGGTVLNSGRKFQINGNAEIELNGADAINNANFVIGGGNSLTLDANSNQANFGIINLNTGSSLTLDLDAAVTNFAFADSSAQNWLTGTVSISGFQEGVIKFGSDASGLTTSQLDAIDGGAYSLTSSGFLTAIPEPGTLTLLLVSFASMALLHRRKR